MPPTKDTLYLYIERAIYQCQLWKKALDYHPHFPHFVEHGWPDVEGSLAVQWVHFKPALHSILEFVSCSWKISECTTNHCSCTAANLSCTNLWCCTNCENKIFDDDDDDDGFGEYQDEGTDGETDDTSDSSKDELFEDDEINND